LGNEWQRLEIWALLRLTAPRFGRYLKIRLFFLPSFASLASVK